MVAKRGRPKGSKTAKGVPIVVIHLPPCPICGSTLRHRRRRLGKPRSLTPRDGQPYTALTRYLTHCRICDFPRIEEVRTIG